MLVHQCIGHRRGEIKKVHLDSLTSEMTNNEFVSCSHSPRIELSRIGRLCRPVDQTEAV